MYAKLLWLAILLTVLGPAGAYAQTCSMTVSNMDFGAANVLPGGAIDTTATLTVNCSGMPAGPVTYYCFGFGVGSGGLSGSTRVMTGSGGSTLRYGIYANSTRTASWGSRAYPAVGAAYGQAGTAAVSSSTGTVYGRILASQSTTPPGSYSSVYSGADVSLYTLVSPSTDCNAGPVAASPTATATFSVLAAVPANCTVTTLPLYFGNQGLLSANVDVNTTMSVRCSNTLTYTVGLSNGVTGTGPTARKMTLSADSITYALYRDAGRTQAWGVTAGTDTAAGTGTGSAQTLTVYGRVPPQTTPPAGGYTDTVNVTVTY